jgi:crotonyl-CoA reductase
MDQGMKAITDAIESGATVEDILDLEMPRTYRAITVHADEVDIFDGMPMAERDPRTSLHLDEVPLPELTVGDVLVGVMASSINHNAVWTAAFEPLPTFHLLRRNAKRSDTWKRHDLPYHIIGSDAAGVVLRVGPGVRRWKPGDRVTIHCSVTDHEDPQGYDDAMLDPGCMAWGWETNFGGLAELTLVRSTQLLPKPEHLTWEEAASIGAGSTTAYRQLVSSHGACMKQGEIVLIWGAATGIGCFATQFALNGGAFPVCVVSNQERADILRRLGCTWIIDRASEGYRLWNEGAVDTGEMARFRLRVRQLTGGECPDIVFEHPGRETFAASVFVARKGGRIVTCASTTGYEHVYDNRYLWEGLKRIIGTHMANYREAWEVNRLIRRGAIQPVLSRTVTLDHTAEGVYQVKHNLHHGKVGVLCLAGREGLGVLDTEMRQRLLDRITLFRT